MVVLHPITAPVVAELIVTAWVATPEHTVWFGIENDNDGAGFTVTTSVKSGPVHPAVEGVTVYVAVCGSVVEFVSDPVIEVPEPEAPIRPPVVTGAGQV